MRDKEAQLAILIIGSIFLLILVPFRKIIAYPFCPLEKYVGKVGKGKATYYLVVHLIISLALALLLFNLVTTNDSIEALFENTVLRLGSIIILLIIFGVIFGWFIEIYLESTDEEYKTWKYNRRMKNV